jgi:hypothetical protein
VGLVAAGLLFRRRQVTEALWVLFFAHSALMSARHVPVFATVTAPLVAAEVTRWWNTWVERLGKKSIPALINQMSGDFARGFHRSSIWPVAFIVVIMFMNAPIHWPTDLPDHVFPTQIVHKHSAELVASRVITTDQWADYLIYVNPAQKVFVDGRSDFFGPEFGNQCLHLVDGHPEWEQTLERYHFTMALLPVEAGLAQLLKQRPDWQITEDDGKRILLVRRGTSVPSTGNIRPEPRF